jgi:N-acetylglucosamine kinase-like BadF-type ATPase
MTISESDPLFLGVDGGGTSTVALLGTSAGRLLGRGKAGPSNAKAVGEENSLRALTSAIDSAFSQAGNERRTADSICLGLAGFDRPEDKRLLAQWNEERGWARQALFVNDGDVVVAAGTPEGWGIGVIAGTGSIAVGRAPDGRTARSGGWGHLMGDEGSAYWVVLNALRLVARRADGRDSSRIGPDPFTTRLCDVLHVRDPSGIVSALYAPMMDRAAIAALAPAIIELARDVPEVGPLLLHPAGSALGEQVVAVARSLDMFRGMLPLALAGGFLLAADEVVSALTEYLVSTRYTPLTTPVAEPARGALILAERHYLSEARDRG